MGIKHNDERTAPTKKLDPKLKAATDSRMLNVALSSLSLMLAALIVPVYIFFAAAAGIMSGVSSRNQTILDAMMMCFFALAGLGVFGLFHNLRPKRKTKHSDQEPQDFVEPLRPFNPSMLTIGVLLALYNLNALFYSFPHSITFDRLLMLAAGAFIAKYAMGTSPSDIQARPRDHSQTPDARTRTSSAESARMDHR